MQSDDSTAISIRAYSFAAGISRRYGQGLTAIHMPQEDIPMRSRCDFNIDRSTIAQVFLKTLGFLPRHKLPYVFVILVVLPTVLSVLCSY